MTLQVGYNTATGVTTASQSSSTSAIGWSTALQCVAAGTANGMYLYLKDKNGSANSVQLSLYSNGSSIGSTGGGTLIANTAQTALTGLTAGQFNYIPFITPVALTLNGYYAPAIQANGSLDCVYYSSSPATFGAHLDTGQNYGTVPSTLPSGLNDFSGALAMYVDGTVGPTYYPQSRRRRIFLPAFYPG